MASCTLVKALGAILALTAVSASSVLQRDTAIPPSRDPFYSQPPGFENFAPGTILKHRAPPAPLGNFGAIPLNLQSAHQIQFRTTNSQGNPDTAVTTVMVPANGNYSRLISYQDVQDSAYVDCAPSYALQVGSTSKNKLSKASTFFEAGLLSLGWIVSIPDYQGSQAAFSSGLQAGHATLDSIRAVLSSSSITGIAPQDVDITMWGYSGGSIATEWAAELQPSYAPELRILGAAIGGTVVNLNNTILSMNNGQYAGLGVAGLWGLYQAFETPELRELVDEELYPQSRPFFEKPRMQCASADFDQFDNQDVFSYFRSGEAFLNKPEMRDIVERTGIMGRHGLPQIPLYFYKAKEDVVSAGDDNDRLVEQFCGQGIKSLQYVRNSRGSHTSESIAGSGGAVGFLRDRFEGVEPYRGCHTRDVWLWDMEMANLKMFGNEILAAIKALFEMPFKE
ncbi:hypothetical protein EG329_013625 [Mollisiaceae sp. DMI_Dod_QoI]|nr:hypothetical protein EG329_013625 [Helotiales sp. DMI_Dod_QoI]